MNPKNRPSPNGEYRFAFKNAHRYYKNALTFIKGRKTMIDGKFYEDRKPVIESAGILWRAVLEAIVGYLLKQGVHEKSLPTSKEAYSAMLKRYSTHNGRLVQTFEEAYHIIHLECYYGRSQRVDTLKLGFQKARLLIERLSGEKLS